MFCKRCGKLQTTCTQDVDVKLIKNIQRIDCKLCKNFITIVENNKVVNIDDKFDDCVDNSWIKVTSDRDKVIYYVLSQIIYREMDTPCEDKFESVYDHADDDDDIYLKWLDNKPVGFYTIKPKGTVIYGTNRYSMTTLDTAYIRSQYRNKGLGLEIINDIIERYPNEDIGFSKPISHGMQRVLNKFLTQRKEYRRRFWEIQDGGIEGSVKLIWFILRSQLQKS
ncbi:soluble lamin-associated protein of 75 kDa-like [Microplitis mediator]|uniref:soluble lamin-associated protein of 75 kDa-like n=1 Tax=Microplitis mediator TaxID=375433 RepID=UPI0025576D30|nr:soluble lamin-associated protein of 75 kDa-like [Microplitis mediator]